MSHRLCPTTLALILALAGAAGCATGELEEPDDAATRADAGLDGAADAAAPPDGAAPADGASADVAADAASPVDAPRDTAPPQTDAPHDTAPPQIDAAPDAGCPAGYTGPACDQCVPSLYKCDQLCVQSCVSCNGKPAACADPKECMTRCTTCATTCADCPTDYHLCPTGCFPDGPDDVATGCSLTCDNLPCAPPAHATARCTDGACDFTCDAAGHWVERGATCECDDTAGFVEAGGVCECDVAAELKQCGDECVSATSPATGCGGVACAACTSPPHGTAICAANGDCDFTCDAANHWVKSGAACVCASGYSEANGVCCPTAACPGTMFGGHCYWYTATAVTFAGAEAACAAQCGHLVSIAAAAENTFVQGLAAADAWIGLRDSSTERRTGVNADDCTENQWINSNGGSYSGSTYYDDVAPCGHSGADDHVYSLNVTTPQVWVFSLSRSSYDTYLGLHNYVANHGSSSSCVGSSIVCDDDSGEGLRSLLVRYLDVGKYVVMVDGYSSDDSGSYVLDARRFTWTDGTVHGWAHWKNDGADDEPNNSSGNEYCGMIYKASGYWNDTSCAGTRGYVCERPF